MRLHTVCHDPAVQALIPFLDAIHGSHRVIAERGGHGGHRSLDAWMQGPGAGLSKVPDIVLENFDGAQSFLLIDVKTLDAAGTTHIAARHTDRTRLAAHRYVTRRAVEHEYGTLPERMRLVVLPISTFGAIGTPGGPSTLSVPKVYFVCTYDMHLSQFITSYHVCDIAVIYLADML